MQLLQFSRWVDSVSLGKGLFNSLVWIWDEGLFYKVRFGFGKYKYVNPIKLFKKPRRSKPQVGQKEEILVVGIGVASFSLVRSLRQLGYTNVKIIARDHKYGGKCVNYACMPSEYYTAYRHQQPTALVEGGQQFVSLLRGITQQSFQGLSYPLVKGEVIAIEGSEVILNTGEKLKFNRLVLATGNKLPSWSLVEPTCSPQQFWEIVSGKLVIVSDGNVASLSYADIALDRGLQVTVIFQSPPLLSHLPSFQYFKRELEKRGIKVILQAKIQEREGNTLRLKVDGRRESIDFDYLMYDGVPELNLPKIDGSSKSILDIDLPSSTVINRPDIYVLGDASGFLSATEAELQAKRLANAWSSGEFTKITDLERLPLRLHALKSFALVGSPWTLLYRDWRSVDFKNLGWSVVHKETGKLWYLYNRSEKKVEAIHICHRDASELISLASILIDLPVTDSRWLTSSVHPNSAEIFKVLIEDIEASNLESQNGGSLLGVTSGQLEKNAPSNLLNLPPIAEIHRSDFYQNTFSPEERSLGVLDTNPSLYFAILLGIKSILNNCLTVAHWANRTIALRRSDNGSYVVRGVDFSYEVEETSASVTVRIGEEKVTVYTGSLVK